MSASEKLQLIRKAIRDVPDFPKPDILFRDITPLLADPQAFAATIDLLCAEYEDQKPDVQVPRSHLRLLTHLQ